MITLQPTQEIALFEFYAKRIWPIHRIFAKHYLSRRCVRCCISSKASPLNDLGVCELCLASHTASPYNSTPDIQKSFEKKLSDVLLSYVGKGEGEYDAMVMVSGGKDSALLLHRIITEYPALRIIALTVDNTFMSPVALSNVKRVVGHFKVPHVVARHNPKIFDQAFSYAFTHLDGNGCAATVDTVDGELFTDIAKNEAAKRKIPLLLVGFSFEQVVTYLHWDSFENREYDRNKRTQVAGFDSDKIVEEKYRSVWWDPSQYEEKYIPHIVCPFFVWKMNEIEVKKKTAELGILTEKEVSPLLTNNALIPLCGLVDIGRLGYSSWEPEFSRMVREGKTDKELWQNIFELLEYSAKTGRFISKSVDGVLKRLGLTREELGIIKC